VYADDDCDTHPVADCSCNHTCRNEEEQVANAQLISAAPDMLVALKWARTCVPFPSDCHDSIVAALAKAEGKSTCEE
jgi:hypothetical protein